MEIICAALIPTCERTILLKIFHDKAQLFLLPQFILLKKRFVVLIYGSLRCFRLQLSFIFHFADRETKTKPLTQRRKQTSCIVIIPFTQRSKPVELTNVIVSPHF